MPPKYSSRVNTVQGDMQTLEASEVGKLINKWLSFWSIDTFTMHLGWFAVSRCINHFSCGCDRIHDNFREENLGLVYGIISLAITSRKHGGGWNSLLVEMDHKEGQSHHSIRGSRKHDLKLGRLWPIIPAPSSIHWLASSKINLLKIPQFPKRMPQCAPSAKIQEITRNISQSNPNIGIYKTK